MGLMYLHFLLLLLFSGKAVSRNIVKTLPGFSGELPFKLETGYVSVGDIEFFYYFVESQGNPGADPLILYMNGGPGCSGLNGFFYQVGPVVFNTTDYIGGLPTFLPYPHSWTKTANIIFVDAPVGTGFSYATTSQAYTTSDTLSVIQTLGFLRNWLNDHPDFKLNPLFIGADSYSGLIAPIIAQEIMDGNGVGEEPHINLKGYLIGSPHTDTTIELNSRIVYAHRMALISDALYEAAKTGCNGRYVDIDPSNAKCVEALESISLCIEQVSLQDILEPKCSFISPKQNKEIRRSLRENSRSFLLPSQYRTGNDWCRNFEHSLSDIWANYKSVQDALYIRPGTVEEFFRCNISLSYTENVNNVFGYHKNLTNSGLRVLVFSGDHDMVIPHVGIEQWIKSLNISLGSDWRPWFVDGQIGGYTRKYVNKAYSLTYSTLKGAGHSPTEYRRRESYEMFYRWIHHYPL
ncbi:hypothetical protein VitviT2T_003714 [Vitis vinifera]|uniref:Serine carboxypeptidase-like 18 n=2 Tax=Vitis vinifera TaxID=29760 RepID=D7T3R9_VITVI|eukprot:XP_002266867.3 PREDICTED: serine carboxypeptidase-like 17 [Vitis vinifera]